MLNKILLGLIILFQFLFISLEVYGMPKPLLIISAINLVLIMGVANIIILNKIFYKIKEKIEEK